MSVLVDVTATPSVFTTGNWPTSLGSSKWSVTVTPSYASGSAPGGYHTIIGFTNDNGTVNFLSADLEIWDSGGTQRHSHALTFSANQTITLTIDPSAGTLTIAGATTGNGTFTSSPWTWTTTGSLYIGRGVTLGTYDFSGTVGDITDDGIQPSSIASAQAFGTAALSRPPGRIASEEAFGTATVANGAAANIAPSGIASAEAFGTAKLPSVFYKASGTISYAAATLTPGYPTLAADDYLVLLVGVKPDIAVVITPSGWTSLGSTLGGSGSTGVDTGPTKIQAFGKVATGSESGTLSVTVGSGNIAWAQISSFSKSKGTWSVAAAFGVDTTTGAAYSAVTTTDVGIRPGDAFLVGISIPTDVTTPAQFSAESISASGVTFATAVEISEPDTSTNNDLGGVTFWGRALDGTSSGNATVAATAGGTTTNVAGPMVLVRLRDGNTITGTGIASAQAFGSATVTASPDRAITATGIASAQAFGTASVTQPTQSLTSVGAIASAQAFGTATIAHGVAPSAIASAQAFGTATVAGPALAITGAGDVASAEAFGTAAITHSVATSAIASAQAFGTASVAFGVAPSGVASGEAFGSSRASLVLSPSGVASSEAFGTSSLTTRVAPSGVASVEAFGSATVRAGASVTCTGIASAEAFGSASLVPVSVVSPSSITSAQAFGSASLTAGAAVTCTGIASAGAFGSASLTAGAAVTCTGIASAGAFGSPVVSSGATVVPSGLPSSESFGSATVTAGAALACTGIGSAQAFGSSSVVAAGALAPSGVASAEAFGSPVVSTGGTLVAGGLASAEAFGAAAVRAGAAVTCTGIPSAETFGSATLAAARDVVAPGIASAQAFGAPTVAAGRVLAPSGIATAQAFGAPSVIAAGAVAPSGIASGEAFGTARIASKVSTLAIGTAEAFGVAAAALVVSLSGIPSASAFGSPTMRADAVVTVDAGVVSGEAFGSHLVRSTSDLYPTSIDGSEALGTPSLEVFPPPRENTKPHAVSIAQLARQRVSIEELDRVAVSIASLSRLHVTLPSAPRRLRAVGGVASAADFGFARLGYGLSAGAGASSAEAFGAPSVGSGIAVAGIASGEAFGTAYVSDAAEYPLIASVSGPRQPRVLILGNGTSPFGLPTTDAWFRDALQLHLSSVTYVEDFADYNPALDPLSGYDVVLMPFNQNYDRAAPSWLGDLITWIQNGGGFVTFEWLVWMATEGSNPPIAAWAGWRTLYAAMPFESIEADNYGNISDFVITNAAHPVMRTLSSPIHLSSTQQAMSKSKVRPRGDGETIANGVESWSGATDTVIVGTSGAGRVAYANLAFYDELPGGHYPAPSTQLAQLIRNMTWWAAGESLPPIARILVLGTNAAPAVATYESWWRDVIQASAGVDVTWVADADSYNPNGADPLSGYDAVVLLCDGNYGVPAPSYLSDLVAYVNAGGGLVSGAWLKYNEVWWEANWGTTTTWGTLSPLFGVTYGTPPGLSSYGPVTVASGLTLAAPEHPIAEGFTSPIALDQMATGSWYAEIPVAASGSGVAVCTQTAAWPGGTDPNVAAVVASTYGAGRTVYLNCVSGTGGGTPPGTGTNIAQLIRNAARWAARLI